MASNTVLASNFNTSKISFSQVKTLDFGGKQAYINYDGGMFVMQTPSCALPYGMSAFDKAGPVKYSVELSLRGYNEPGNKMKQFYDAIAALDEFMIDQGVKNSQQWFKSSLSREVIKAFYTPMVRFSKDKEGNPKPYPPTIKLALKQKRDSQDFDIKLVDAKRQDYKGIPLEELLVKGANVTCLIQATGVWFAGSKYGVSWKAVYVRVDSLPRSAGAFEIVDDGELASAPATSAAPAMVEDSEEEEEEEEAPVPAKKSVLAAVMPAPAPAPVPAPTIDDEADDAEPVPVPKKTVTVVKKKVVAKKA
jgi:hypothetical protein